MIDVQKLLLEEAAHKLGGRKRLTVLLSELLNVSEDSAYRRISGRTNLSIQEGLLIAEEMNISLDDIQQKNRGTIAFERRSTLKTENDIAIHLKEMGEMMKLQIQDAGGPSIYTTKDIPVFYHFYKNELGAFKVYCWHRALNTSKELNAPFDPSKYTNDYHNLFGSIRSLYSKVPSIEIWSEIAVLGFIRQLQYYYDSGLMGTREMALLLIEQHQSIFDLMQEQARLGKKIDEHGNPTDADYELYFNELFVMDNAAFANLKSQKIFFSSYAYFNYIPTIDPLFCNDVEQWLQNQMKRSIKLSSGREKERNLFFKNIRKELEKTSDYIKSN
jgi:hypothetical protein